ncbi:methyl-accepting chemotaxis protein [Pseudomonas brassicacearum]|uniref:methyl-accepting chemotaxis protein n=1 Tax=Pseudomonas brassicacearum TaxID=930166 RepID=UPI001BDF24AD|nr:methyl-accepting chemotaxis protein [Pseudomonas brassicacearum]
MTIVQRISCLIGLAVLGLGLVAGIGSYQASAVFDAASYGNVNTVPSLILLDEASSAFWQQRVSIQAHVLNADAAATAAIETTIKQAREARAAAFKNYEPLISDDKDRQMLADDRTLAAAYDEVTARVLEQSRTNHKDQARNLLTDGVAIADKLNAAITQHFAYNQQLGNQGAADAVAVRVQWTVIAGVASVLVLSLIVLIGWRIAVIIQHQLGGELHDVARIANDIAAGQLQMAIAVRSGDEASVMASMKRMADNLRAIVGEIDAASRQLSTSATGLAVTTQQVNASTRQQSDAASSMSAAVEELTVSIAHISDSSQVAGDTAHEANGFAENGGKVVMQAVAEMDNIMAAVAASSDNVNQLAEQSSQISVITAVIKQVADQTNLLALNAAIEAARAGEQGRGFSVVADEVRELAGRTARSAQEIIGMVQAIQQGTQLAIEAMAQSTERVKEGARCSNAAGMAMNEIRRSNTRMQDVVAGIASALQEQRSASLLVAEYVDRVAQMTEETSVATNTLSQSAASMQSLADRLNVTMRRFTF